MNLNQLKIFYFAAKYENLSLAAEALYITQPAVTKGIQRLQEHYEIKFVNRFGKKLALTDSGEVLYEIAEKIFEMESQAEESISDFQQQKRGHIRIHSGESFGAYYLPSIINPFSKLNPHIRISVNILPTEQVVENSIKLNSDLGFISYPVEHNKVTLREVLEDRLVIIAPPDHPLTRKSALEPRDLKGQSLIMHEKGSATRAFVDEFIKKNNITITIPLELSSNMAIKQAVQERIGIAIISRKVVSDEIQKGELKAIPFSDQQMKRKFYMIHHKDKYFSGPLKSLIDMVYQWSSEYSKELQAKMH
jgi:DNA-binding transcriptional LysR family regulator